jgi:hypothetical protein
MGKRAPGAGRKPQGQITGKVSTFSTRITAETRVALDMEAKRTGRSVSQVAEEILRRHFEKEAAGGDKATRALCYLVSEAAHLVSGARNADGSPKWHWRSDPFMFRALEIVLPRILQLLRPEGELKPPSVNPIIADLYDTPERRADFAFGAIVTALESYEPAELADQTSELQALGRPGQLHVRQVYGFSSARRDLGLGGKK